MKNIGWILMSIGFLLAASQATSRTENEVPWAWFAPAAILAVGGVVLARIGAHREETEESRVSANVAILDTTIGRIAEKAVAFHQSIESMDVYDLHAYIDKHFVPDLNAFAEARKSMIPVYGLQVYAEVMNDFAAGERYLNRVWSCSVDGYIDEAQEFVKRSRDQFVDAQAKLGRESARVKGTG